MDSMSSGDSYWENTGLHGYVMQAESIAQQRHDQHQDQQQRVMIPVPMMATPFGYVPLA